jgi:hypothetical protein
MRPRIPFGFPRGPGASGMLGGNTQWLPAFMAIIMILAIACALALWVIRSIALMRMARKLGFPDPWLAWIPGAGEYLFVKTAGEKQRKLGIAYMFVMYFGMIAGAAILAAGCIPAMMSGVALRGGMMYGAFAPAALGMLPGIIFLACVAIAAFVLRLILLYSIFRRFKPESSVVFLVLSIFFKFLGPIFLLVSSFSEPDIDRKGPAPTVQSDTPAAV